MPGISTKYTLDTSGKSCPIPMIETNLTIKKLQTGEILEIIATDPSIQNKIPSWCERKGHRLLESVKENATLRYFVRKGENET